jgi:hypothetical protein
MPNYNAPDDPILFALRRDLSGGMNNRQHEEIIGDTQAVLLENVLLETAGSRIIRTGQTRLDAAYPASAGAGLSLFGFDPDGGTFELLAVQGATFSACPIGGTFTDYHTLTTGLQTTIIKAGMTGQNDVALISNGTDNVHLMIQDHTITDLADTNTSPPLTTALCYYGNRVWALKNNLLYFSSAFPADYAAAFDRTTNAFRMPVGTARALIGTRDQGIICFGADQIWRLLPASTTPAPTTDFPEKILEIGCVNGNTCVQVADDIFFLSPDGVRGLMRTQLDKLQTGQSFPLSYNLQDEFNSINWAQINKASAIYFENKYIISLPVDNSTTNNECWVFYPAMNAWTIYTGWNIARFAKIRVNGQEALYGIDSANGRVYRLFYGTTDNGTAITYEEISRAEDFGQPMLYKMGGEYRVKLSGGNGTIVASANADSKGWVQLGTVDLEVVGVSFPTTFPMAFGDDTEVIGNWHLDDAGITKFKRVKFENWCDTSGAAITILESSATAFQEDYVSEG